MVNISELKKQILLEDIADSGLEKLSKITRELSLKKMNFSSRKTKTQRVFI